MGGRAVAIQGRDSGPKAPALVFWVALSACTAAAVFIRGAAFHEGFYGEWNRRANLVGASRSGSWALNSRLEGSGETLSSLSHREIHPDYVVTAQPLKLKELGRTGGFILYEIAPP